jgi:hypothetical protein
MSLLPVRPNQSSLPLTGEMRQRSADAVKTLLPAEWLQAYADA